MNSAIVQGGSYLDSAWPSSFLTSPAVAKLSRTSRKQKRSCDQCRKGKRACNAAILEDSLFNNSGDGLLAFHYSDAFGPLAPCGNCEKMSKVCTFEWLRSRRVPRRQNLQSNTTPSTKRYRDPSSSADLLENEGDGVRQTDEEWSTQSDARVGANFVSDDSAADLNKDSTDPVFDAPAFNLDSLAFWPNETCVPTDKDSSQASESWVEVDEVSQEDDLTFNHNGDKCLPSGTIVDGINGVARTDCSHAPCSIREDANRPLFETEIPIQHTGRKRRCFRSSSRSSSDDLLPTLFSPLANDLASSTNNAFIREGLLKIYHDSFENALSCWLIEQTCPYSLLKIDNRLVDDASPDRNRMYTRVFQLDHMAIAAQGKQLTARESSAASKALNLAVLSFATQWAQDSDRSKVRSPVRGNKDQISSKEYSNPRKGVGYDRALQISAWHEARIALQNAGSIECFRVAFAHIVFSLTQEPIEGNIVQEASEENSIRSEVPVEFETWSAGNKKLKNWEDVHSKLNLALDAEGPPIHLEQGLRLVHSLRSRMMIYRVTSRAKRGTSRTGPQHCPQSDHLDTTNQATVDLLFWLGVMFDTLSSVIHKRPLVVSDEDSDNCVDEYLLLSDSQEQTMNLRQENVVGGLWDEYLFARQGDRSRGQVLRWPCSYDQASSLLRDAAPIKVLLFRKITRIQSILTRSIHGNKVEMLIEAALNVCEYWEQSFSPFIQDCIQNHDHLPSRIQSWYICLTGHWHLGTLLLADLIEAVDDCRLGLEEKRHGRDLSSFVSLFRQANCRALSDLAKSTCPRSHETTSFSRSDEFHFAVNSAALLTEPWTAVLVRAFAKAGVILLESAVRSPLHGEEESDMDMIHQSQDCIEALWFLGRKSDIALSAATILWDSWRRSPTTRVVHI